MGNTEHARCKKCGTEFNVSFGGGFYFHLLRCDRCGKEKPVGFEELGDINKCYMSRIAAVYSVATGEFVCSFDKAIDNELDLDVGYDYRMMTKEEYFTEVEKWAGEHNECGGHFRFNVPPRCPECRSVEMDFIGAVSLYD